MTVFPGLGGRHLHDFARTAFEHHEAVLAQGRALHRVGGRRAGISRLKVLIQIVMFLGHVEGGGDRYGNLREENTKFGGAGDPQRAVDGMASRYVKGNISSQRTHTAQIWL